MTSFTLKAASSLMLGSKSPEPSSALRVAFCLSSHIPLFYCMWICGALLCSLSSGVWSLSAHLMSIPSRSEALPLVSVSPISLCLKAGLWTQPCGWAPAQNPSHLSARVCFPGPGAGSPSPRSGFWCGNYHYFKLEQRRWLFPSITCGLELISPDAKFCLVVWMAAQLVQIRTFITLWHLSVYLVEWTGPNPILSWNMVIHAGDANCPWCEEGPLITATFQQQLSTIINSVSIFFLAPTTKVLESEKQQQKTRLPLSWNLYF